MGECSRIYGNPRRLAAIALITLLSVLFFLVGQLPFYGSGAIQVMLDGEEYASELTARLRGLSAEDQASVLEDEMTLAENCLYLSDERTGSLRLTEEEVRAGAASRPAFAELLNAEDSFQRINRFGLLARIINEATEQSSYAAGYSQYLEQVQKQAETQSQTSIFGKENTFSNRNLVRTASEFASILDVKVQFCASRGLSRWVDYEMADYLYLLLIILFVFAFLEERHEGLWGVIRCCRDGRAKIGLQRVVILFSAAVLGVVLIYGINLVLALTILGGWQDLGCSIQSLSAFRTLTIHVTIGGWIVRYLLEKVICGVVVGLFLWCVLGSLTSIQYALVVLGSTVAVEYALFAFLPVQSILNPVKYFNLFSYVRSVKLYTDYLNINLFGYPFGTRQLSLAALPVFLVVFLVWAISIQARKYPSGNRNILGKIANRWDTFLDVFRRRISIGGWELYKSLFFQRALLIIFVIILVSGSLSYVNYNMSGIDNDRWVQAYLRDLQGPLRSDLPEYLASAREKTNGDAEMLSALDYVESYLADVQTRAEEGGYRAWVVHSDSDYKAVYGDSSVDHQRMNAAVAIMLLIFCSAPVAAFEQQSGVTRMLRSLKRGRGSVFLRKQIVVLVHTAVVFAAVYLREFSVFVQGFHPIDLASPVGNFRTMVAFPMPGLSIGKLMSLIYVLRFVMLFLVGMMIQWISERVSTVETSYLLNIAVLGLPAILYALGISFLGYLSPVMAVTSAEAFWNLATLGSVQGFVPVVLWGIVGIAAIVLNARRWTGRTD